MNNDFKNNDDREAEYPRLKRLLQQIESENSRRFVRPSDDAIWAFLTGEPSEKEREEVLTALASSTAFRQEMLELTEDVEFLKSEQAAREFDKVRVPETFMQPVLGEAESRRAPKAGGLSWFDAWFRLRGALTPRRRAVALVGTLAVLAVVIVQHYTNQPSRMTRDGHVARTDTSAKDESNSGTQHPDSLPLRGSPAKPDTSISSPGGRVTPEPPQREEITPPEPGLSDMLLARLDSTFLNDARSLDESIVVVASGTTRGGAGSSDRRSPSVEDARSAAEQSFFGTFEREGDSLTFIPRVWTRRATRDERGELELRAKLQSEREVYRSESAQVAQALTDLGIQLRAQKRYAEAESLFNESLDIRRRVLGPGHSQTADNLENLADLRVDTKHFAGAESLYIEALRIRQGTSPRDDLGVLRGLTSLQSVLRTDGGQATAQRLAGVGRPVTLVLVGEGRKIEQTLTAVVPASAENVQAWLLALPSLQLQSADMPSDSMKVSWPTDLGRQGCAVFTYWTSKVYLATDAVYFQLDH